MSPIQKFRSLFPQDGALSSRAAVAAAWSMGELAISHALRLASNLIMTRLLLPEAFGLMAMVSTVHFALAMLTDIGISQSVTRSPEGATRKYLRVIWTIQLMRCAAITCMIMIAGAGLWMIAPYLAANDNVYADPELPLLIVFSSLSILISGFASTNQFLAARNIRLSRIAVLNISTQIITIIAMVSFARINASVWALLLGIMVGNLFHAALSHVIFEGPRMGFDWDSRISRDVWSFGKWIMGSSAITAVAASSDRFILGAFLDKETFGFYVIATLWLQAFLTILGKLIGQIGFPAFSEVLRDRPEDIQRVLRRFSRLVDLMCVAGFLAFLLGGGFLINLLYPPNYLAAANYIPFLAVVILRERFTVLSQLLLSYGDSKAMAMTSGATLVMLYMSLPLGFHYFGVEGALLAIVLSPLAGVIPILIRVAPFLGDEIRVNLFWFAGICLTAVLVFLVMPPL